MDPITTERLLLRRFRRSDAADLFAYLQTPRASCFLDLRLEDLAAAEKEAKARSRREGAIAVCLRDNGQLIGDLFAEPEREGDTVSVGWNFNAEFGGRGYALEAAQALFAHLFTTAGARRLYAYVEDHNLPSQRLCEKLGMRQEGLFLEFVAFGVDPSGAPLFENTMQYALLRREWSASRSTAADLDSWDARS